MQAGVKSDWHLFRGQQMAGTGGGGLGANAIGVRGPTVSLFASAACVGILAKLAVVRPAVTSWQGAKLELGKG